MTFTIRFHTFDDTILLSAPQVAEQEAGDHLDFLGPTAAQRMASQHVLSGSRLAVARVVAACVHLNLPVLLEGPAAVGKTSLVTALAQHLGEAPCHLERVNNTESTGLQVSHQNHVQRHWDHQSCQDSES